MIVALTTCMTTLVILERKALVSHRDKRIEADTDGDLDARA